MLLRIFGNWTIKRKLVVGVAGCLCVFLIISMGAGVVLTRRAVARQVLGHQLPAEMARLVADVTRVISVPLTASLDMASTPLLLDWEAAGEPIGELPAIKSYSSQLKARYKAATVSWVSGTSRHLISERGIERTVSPSEVWFDQFIASGKPYELNFGLDQASKELVLYVNARWETGGKAGIAGLGLPLGDLVRQMTQYKIGKTGIVMLARPDGTIITHPDPRVSDGAHRLSSIPGFDRSVIHDLLNASAFSHIERRVNGVDLILLASYLPDLDLYIVGSVPKSELLSDATRAAIVGPVAAGIVAGSLTLLLAIYVAGVVAGPVGRAAALLTEISKGDGDLSKRIEVESNDELGKLASSFNHFVGSLEVTVLSIRQASDSIVTATDEVAAGNENLSSRTEETSSSLQRTSAVLAQIAEEASRSAENARDADSLARAAHGTAERGGAVMESVQRTMDSIDDSSRRIGAIIGVIDGIAFQTNILALNAAVEAARAGEHGRGFAVVASEVRSLALRSADAAKQVRELIAESMHQTESGAALVRTAVHTVQEIRNGVSGVAQLIEGISSRTRQQSDGIGAVNATVSQLDTMTQQNAALVEEVSSAAESLKEQANALTLAVGRFKLS